MSDRSDPFAEVERFFERMQEEFGELAPDPADIGLGVGVDVIDDGDAVVVVADLPGVDADDVDVSVRDRRLRIVATRETGRADGEYVRRERHRRRLERNVRLPAAVEAGAAEATHEDGVLTITLPKRHPDEEHTIEVE